MKLSLIISYYKNEKNLELIFKALSLQSAKDFEVIVAEDDCETSTPEFINEQQRLADFPILLLSQKKDDGFRKNEMLNRAIVEASAEKICFIDGDCIPHKHFIRTYQAMISDMTICFGKRVNLGEKISKKILETGNLRFLKFWNVLRSDSGKVKEGLYLPFSLRFKDTHLLGCNWGVLKKHLLEVNGFDADYTAAGVGEDVDIEWRLCAIGLKMQSTKNRAIVYHIYHTKGYSDESVQLNYQILENKKRVGNLFCLNGIKKTSVE
jgi:glycosyltransferase involved in cell wall biosynthesis